MVQFFVTFLDNVGPHLQVFGQLDLKHMEVVQSNIDSVISQAKHAEPVGLEIGLLCLARRFDKYSRARVLALEGRDCVTVHFIDYGDDQTVHIQELQIFKLPKMLESFPKQVSSYFLSGIFFDWKPYQIQDISRDICNTLADMRVEIEIGDFQFVRLTVGRQDFADYIINHKRFGLPISNEKLRETFCLLMENTYKIKPQTVYNNNIIKSTARGILPVRGISQGNNMNMGYYPVTPMVSSAPMGNVPRTDGSVVNPTTYKTAIMGMNAGNFRMPYKAPDNKTYYTKTPEGIDQQISPKRSVATFKSNTLMVGKIYDVYCCYVENGPCSFSIHLKANEDNLNAMMSELENVPLKNLNEKPSLGMACIARFSEDGQLYRAVIMSIKPTACQVAYVDYGNTETVTFPDLYEIPTTFLDEKVFAVRFALSGYKDLEPIDESIKNTFKEMVLHRPLKLKVMPLEGPPLVQYCELYDGKLNILDALKNHRNKKLRYSQPEILHANDLVVICYVESPKKFFVQKVANTESFEQMMDDLFLYCKQTRNALSNLSTGTACAVKFENAWYRAEITGSSGNRVSIRHVDFGNERKVDPIQLCSLTDRLVQFPPQAVQCCLKGFENTETLSESATVQMEMLAESDDSDRRHFKCQIFKIEQDGSAVVNLIDNSIRPELNLMKRLYKLSMPFNKYIGLEKEDVSFETQTITRTIQNDSHSSVITTNPFVDEPIHSTSSDWDSGNVHCAYQPPSSDCGSSGSGDTKDTRNSSGDGRSRRFQARKPFKENNRREQPYSTFKGKNLPPRFQKQGENNRRFKENKFSESYEKPRNFSSETSGKFSQYSPKSPQHQHEIQCDDTWGEDDVSTIIVDQQMPAMEEYLPPESTFVKEPLAVPIREDVTICWWISPHQFYIHLKSKTGEFESMMQQMQIFYKNKNGTNSLLSVGSSVIARYREDNILYRAKIIACNQSLRKYKVEFVDFGNQSTAGESDIYLVEKRFSSFPVMAHLCAFENVISNFDHNYITSKIEHYIKGSNSITCEFLRLEQDDLYYVNVGINGNSLKELMINDGLLSALETDMKLEMLAGQQIKATILSITDLLNFKIEIEGCGFELLCSYNDIKFVKSNPHLSSEFKKGYEGASCIVDVVDVTGEKILMLQPHIALFTNELPSTICNYPVLYQSTTVRVAYVLNENKIYLHPIIVDDILAQLLTDMFNYYDTQGEVLEDPKPGMLCAANYSGTWYRGRIISVINDSVEVYYIDYGNSEIIDSKQNLKVLDNSFYNSSALAIAVYLPLKCINDKEEAVINEIQSLTYGHELTLHIIERYKSCWIGDISSGGYSLINVLEDKSLVQGRDIEYLKNLIDHECANKVAIPQSTIIQKTAIQTPEVVVNNHTLAQPIESTIEASVDAETQDDYTKNMISAYLSHCDNPGRFFLHLTKDFDELTKLQDNIQIVAGSLPPLMRIVTGAPCIALYSVDDTWYRAKIIDNEIMAVQFIDYGNTDVITDSSYIKEMNEAFAKIEPFVVSCSLTVAPKGTIDWIDEANTIFNESFDKTVYFNYVSKNQKKNFIDLVIDGQNVGEKLIADGLARQLETVRSGENCFISHINSLSDFYIQMELDADALELIAGHLAGYEDFPVLTNPTEGIICAALFPDDGEWYRAKILAQTDEGIEVLFMDYGNTSVTKEVRHISDEIASLPFLSKKCSLRMPENILGWSDTAEAKFAELSAQGQTVFVVQLAEPGDHAVVELYEGTRNIYEDLEPLCDKKPKIDMDSSIISEKGRLPSMSDPDLRNALISHVNSPMNFYVQFTTDNDQLYDITNTLNSGEEFEKIENPEIDTICIAVFPDDGALYRAKVLSVSKEGFNVLFIDFGNNSVTSELFVLPDNLKSIESLAKCCALENLSSHIDFGSNKAIENFNSILESFGSETLQLEIVNQVVDPWIVRIFCKHVNINKELTESLAQNGSEVTDNLIADEILQERVKLILEEEQNTQEKSTTDPEQSICNSEPDVQETDETPLDDGQANKSENNAEIHEQASTASNVCQLDEVNEIVDPSAALNAEQVDKDGTKTNEISPVPSLEHLDEDKERSKELSAASSAEQLDEDKERSKELSSGSSAEQLDETVSVPTSEYFPEDEESPGEPFVEHSNVDEANSKKEHTSIPSFKLLVQDEEQEKRSISAASSLDNLREVEGSRGSSTASSHDDLREADAKDSRKSSAAPSVEDLYVEAKGSKEPSAAPSVEDLLEAERKGSKEVSAAPSLEDLYVDAKGSKELSVGLSHEHLLEPETKGSKDSSRVTSLEDLSIKAKGSKESSATPSIEHLNEVETNAEKPSVVPSFEYSDEMHLNDENLIASPTLSTENLDGRNIQQNESLPALAAEHLETSKEKVLTGLPLLEDFLSTESESAELRLQPVLISHVLSPREFYVQLHSKSVGLKKVTDLLEGAQVYEKLAEPKVGNLCIANSPDDGAYYRAKILSIEKDDAEVYLIDYGNKVTTGDLRVLPEDLPALEPVALKCSIAEVAGIDLDDQRTIETFNFLLESHFGETFEMQPIEQDGETTVVKLFFQKACIGDKLQKILNEETNEPELVNRFKKIFICHTNSPVDFYIQFSEDIPQFEKITESLTRANEFETATDLEVHELYAAKFPDDGAFYRAKILSKTDSSVDVLFIDFGNTATTDDIKMLPEDLLNIKPVATHCALENNFDYDFFTESASDLFCSLIASHLNETFQAEVVDDSSDPWVIKLFHQGNNLGEKLVKGLKGGQLTKKMLSRQSIGRNTSDNSSHEFIAFDEKKMYSSIELGEELWKGYLGLSGFSNVRAVSTSNIPRKRVATGSSLSISVQEEDTRSKSSDCLNVTPKK